MLFQAAFYGLTIAHLSWSQALEALGYTTDSIMFRNEIPMRPRKRRGRRHSESAPGVVLQNVFITCFGKSTPPQDRQLIVYCH